MTAGLLGAVQFLTRIPIRLRTPPNLTRCVPWFPVVGALVGTIVGATAAGMMHVVPPSVAAGVAIVTGVALTGAFHEDGLADTADALGGWSPQQRREILKDSRHGSYGVAAMCSTIVLRTLCVASLSPAAAFAGVVAAHTLGRGAAVGVMGTASSVPQEGLGADYARGLGPRATAIGVGAAIGISVLAVGWWTLALVPAVAAGSVATTLLARRAFGGISGDILGAVEQVGESLVLIAVSGLALHHDLWWAR